MSLLATDPETNLPHPGTGTAMDRQTREAVIPKPLREWLSKVRAHQRNQLAEGYQHNVASIRDALQAMTRTFVTRIPDCAMIRDAQIQGPAGPVPVRVYHPEPDQPLPVALFLHGGGHMGGGVEIYDPIVRKLARATRRVMVAVEYRLVPEHPYPAGLQDSLTCARHVLDMLAALCIAHQPRLALIGDSAGAALSASIAHRCQFEPKLTIERQVLIYPSLDYTMSKPSMRENGEGYLLERSRIKWMFDAYLKEYAGNWRDVSPLFMKLNVCYPQTLVITAGFDPLCDEGRAYAEQLRAAGIHTVHLHLPEMIHAYLNLEELTSSACQQTYAAIAEFLSAT